MHATIRCYQGVSVTPQELAQAERCLGSTIGRAPGLVACLVLEVGPSTLATVSIFEEQVSLEAAERMVEVALVERLCELLPSRPEATTGEVVYQKGL